MELHHLLLHHPHQASLIVTLSFVLLTNVFFIALVIRHELRIHLSILSGDTIISLLSANLTHVTCLHVHLTYVDIHHRLFEKYLQHLFPSSFDSRSIALANDRFNICLPRCKGRSSSPSPRVSPEIWSVLSRKI